MTKRARPFESHIYRQLKVHLSDYEIDQNALKDSQERTLTKLLEGSKKLYSGKCLLKSTDVEQPTFDNEKKFVQKSVASYFTSNGKVSNSCNKNIIPSTTLSTKCSFCEIDTNYLHQCINCRDYYCGSCSFSTYESIEESKICMSCS